MATAQHIQQGYGNRYEKIKSNRMRSISPSHYEHGKDRSPHTNNTNQYSQNQIGRVVAQLSDRIDGVEIKIVNITNIVKLLQKYTQTKDVQYEKQKQNEEYRKIVGEKSSNIQSLQIQTKINELQSLIQRTKAQITAMEGLRISIQRQNSKKAFSSPEAFDFHSKGIQSPPTNTKYTNSKQILDEIEEVMDKVQGNLREQMNKKIDICINFVKNHAQNQNQSSRNSSPSAVNAIMMQEQLHNMTLTVNKVESDCSRNKMIIQNKIDQIVKYLNSSSRQKSSGTQRQNEENRGSTSRRRMNINEDNKSENSSISKYSKRSRTPKSKAKQKAHEKQGVKISEQIRKGSEKIERVQQQKKQKQTELRQALRKKKENQERLKMKK